MIRQFAPPLCVTCHMLGVTCYMTCVICHVSHVAKTKKYMNLSVEGLLASGPTPSSYIYGTVYTHALFNLLKNNFFGPSVQDTFD